jgi:hypothetical protein
MKGCRPEPKAGLGFTLLLISYHEAQILTAEVAKNPEKFRSLICTDAG